MGDERAFHEDQRAEVALMSAPLAIFVDGPMEGRIQPGGAGGRMTIYFREPEDVPLSMSPVLESPAITMKYKDIVYYLVAEGPDVCFYSIEQGSAGMMHMVMVWKAGREIIKEIGKRVR